MKATTFALIATTALVASAFTVITATSWQVKDDNYTVGFDTKGAKGTMKGLKGTINFDAANLPQSNFDVTVDVNTINTGNGLKNKHAKSDGFFDVGKYPTIQFTSSKIEKTATGFQSTGKLKIKDATNDIVIPFVFENTGSEGTFKGNFEINRKDYHLEKGGVGEVIKIEIVLPVKK